VSRSTETRHIQAYLNDASLEQLVQQTPASGSQWAGPGDAITVLSGQTSTGPVAPMVDQSLAADVTLGNDGTVTSSQLTVTLTNHYNQRLPIRQWTGIPTTFYDPASNTRVSGDGVFATLLTILLPPLKGSPTVTGSDAVSVQGSLEGGTQVSVYVTAIPDQTREIKVTYVSAPVGLTPGSYTLHLQKQAGTEAVPLTVRIHTSSAQEGVKATGGLVKGDAGIWTYEGSLHADANLGLNWGAG
jgi:hypothetical protein